MQRILFLFFFFLLKGGFCFSSGLAVSPAGLLIQDVPLGKTVDVYRLTGVDFTIYNRNSFPSTFFISTYKPSQVGNKKWEWGYSEIPDPSWCWVDREKIEINGGGKGKVRIFLKIPNDERFYNQHWVVVLGVVEKMEGGISLRVFVRIQIETQSCGKVKVPPWGELGVSPSKIIVGKKGSYTITLFNNKDKERKIEMIPLTEMEKLSPKTYLTRFYSHPGDSSWFSIQREVILPPKSCKTLKIRVFPEKLEKRKKWEEIIFCVSGEEVLNFFRLQWRGNEG